MKALINKIIPTTFIDGPGSRMAVFLQGCNMGCLYCHNPETQNICSHCGICVRHCPSGALYEVSGKVIYNSRKCLGCDSCVQKCPHFSSPKCMEMDLEVLYERILEAADFLDGITLSGGECTLQHEFVYGLFKKVKENTALTTFIDTNGLMTAEVFLKLCEVTDGFMFDLKAPDNEKHKALTGAGNEAVLQNMRTAAEKGLLYEVRTVLVQGFTDEEMDIRAMAGLIGGLPCSVLWKLIPFRTLGVRSTMGVWEAFDRERYAYLYGIAYGLLGDRVGRAD